MPDTRKPSRPSRDPRLDSKPPAALGEAPLASSPYAATLPPAGRVASLQAEVERLRAERETDADETAGMLVQIAESDRMRAAAQSQAVVAVERIEALQSDLDEARSRVGALEAEVAGLRDERSLAEARLCSARETITTALALLEEMQRREELASSMRARSVRDTLRALGQAGADGEAKAPPSDRASGPESSVEIVGTHDMDWDLDLAEPGEG
jgi:septal ring factor EnvC (AmiA/AmiB activator)